MNLDFSSSMDLLTPKATQKRSNTRSLSNNLTASDGLEVAQAMRKEINCINFKGLISFLRNHYGTAGIGAVTDGLIGNDTYLIKNNQDSTQLEPVTLDHLTDPACWVSNEFSLRLLANVKKIIKGPNPLFEAACGAVRESLSKSALFAGRLLGPHFFARQAARLNSRCNRTKRVITYRIDKDTTHFQLHYLPQYRVTKDICNWNLGIYTELARLTGVTDVHAKEIRCVLNGNRCCEFRLTWKQASAWQRLYKGFKLWMMQSDVREMVEEFQQTLNERDRLLEELARSEATYRSMFENTATANAIIERNDTITMVNGEFEKLTGWSKAEIENHKRWQALLLPIDRVEVEQTIKNSQGHFQFPENGFEFRIAARDGDIRYVLCKVGRIPKAPRAVVSLVDVTEAKKAQMDKQQLEAKLQRAEKMETVGTLAGGVAHDLNNILSGIVSYPELLLMQLPEDSPMRKPIETIHNSGKRATAIVQDMLTMARRGVVVSEVIALNEVVSVYLTSPEFEKLCSFHPKVKIHFAGEPGLKSIVGSPVHLTKTVMNLVSNAAEAMPDGGQIRITTDTCLLEHPRKGYELIGSGEYVRLIVRDSGVGISAKDMEHIFEPFYTKKIMGRSGTGLGMAVVWGTVKDHKGYIDIESSEGDGTCFKLYFPVSGKQPAIKTQPEPVKIERGRGESILVVDDAQNQLEIAVNILKELGYHPTAVAGGEAAIDALRNRTYQLVILDMIMEPGIDGLDTYRRIKAIAPNLRVIIASGFSESDRVKEAQHLGAGRFIRKPYSIESIAGAVHGALHRSPKDRP